MAESNLLGRGGAAFPTGTKWEAVARQPAQPHYLVCNADESEPGTFKDRVLMEGDPFALVEAMTIAAYATGCERGFVYVRAEYPLAHARLENAFAQARAAGLLGDDVIGAGFAFDIELRIGAGAYVCGEETALFQSIEGYRGEPRNKPPFPVEVGLFGKPTVENNVETLVNVLEIVDRGRSARHGLTARALLRLRPRRAAGPVRAAVRARPAGVARPRRLAAAEGRAARRSRRLVPAPGPARPAAHLRGGARGGSRRSAPASSSSTTSRPISSTQSCGSPSSSATSRAASAFPAASAPCARRRRCTGSRRAPANGDEPAVLADLEQVMRDASICGLGQTAASAVVSAIENLKVLVH